MNFGENLIWYLNHCLIVFVWGGSIETHVVNHCALLLYTFLLLFCFCYCYGYFQKSNRNAISYTPRCNGFYAKRSLCIHRQIFNQPSSYLYLPSWKNFEMHIKWSIDTSLLRLFFASSQQFLCRRNQSFFAITHSFTPKPFHKFINFEMRHSKNEERRKKNKRSWRKEVRGMFVLKNCSYLSPFFFKTSIWRLKQRALIHMRKQPAQFNQSPLRDLRSIVPLYAIVFSYSL